MEIGETKLVEFNEYCATCKYKDLDEKDDPCFECLDEPVNTYSHKPTKWASPDE